MKLNYFLLAVSLCTTLSTTCSNERTASHESMPQLMTIDLEVDSGSAKSAAHNNLTHQKATENSSTLITDFWYGSQRVLGKSLTDIFNDKVRNGTVEGDLKSNPTAAMNDFNNAMKQRIKARDLTITENQEKITGLFNTAKAVSEKAGVVLELTPATAANFKKTMKSTVEQITDQHANIDLPRLEEDRTARIAKINDEHLARVQLLLNLGKPAASNYNELHTMSKESDIFNKAKGIHYEDTDTYQAFLRLYADPTKSFDETFIKSVREGKKRIALEIKIQQNIHRQMARIMRDQQPPHENSDIIDDKHFSTTKNYLAFLATITDKKQSEITENA